MGARPRHPNKEIEHAVVSAEERDWRVVMTKGHGWARLLCPYRDRTGCQISVYSTPKKPESHARQILRLISNCTCEGDGNEEL